MRKIKIITILLISVLTIFVCSNQTTKTVYANDTFVEDEKEFRAAWVSYITNDIHFDTIAQYKADVEKILDIMEYYNMNAIIFHVRAVHDAWYDSKINKRSSQLIGLNFDEFDPLEYVIEASHKRGIEFHAWLNPYRIGTSGQYSSVTEIVDTYQDYQNNPASSASNILMGESIQILDPGLPSNREFIIDTCMEVVENYDVDAIHFDDYFYAKGINDYSTRQKYNTTNLSISDFRRAQVDTFIKDLKDELDKYNEENNRFVQLGISPTGVYKNASSMSEAKSTDYQYNANGDLIYPTGATMGCQMHYESYLYCDTLKWVNEEWINYILPQTYWSQSHSSAPFERLINWWNAAVAKKNVNLYAGMGIYMWASYGNDDEALEQLQITSELPNVKGTSIFRMGNVMDGYYNLENDMKIQMDYVKEDGWTKKALLPEIKGFEPVKLGSVKHFYAENNFLQWDALDGAKFYVIYRGTEGIDYSNEQIVDIIQGTKDIVNWSDPQKGDYIYDVVPISYTNTLGEPTKKVATYVEGTVSSVLSSNSFGTTIISDKSVVNLLVNQTAYIIPDGISASNFNWISTDSTVASVNASGSITTLKNGTTEIIGTHKTDSLKICKVTINVYSGTTNNNSYTVKFVDWDGSILKTETVKYGSSATPPAVEERDPSAQYEFTFAGWDKTYHNITSNITIQAIYSLDIVYYPVVFKNQDGTILKEEMVGYGKSAFAPENPVQTETAEYEFVFQYWDTEYDYITGPTIVTAIYRNDTKMYVLEFETNGGTEISDKYTFTDEITYISSPTKKGYVFGGWYKDQAMTQEVKFPCKVLENMTLYAKWLNIYTVNYYDEYNNLIHKEEVVEGNSIAGFDYQTASDKEFIGWLLDGADYSMGEVTSNLDLYAKVKDLKASDDEGGCSKCSSFGMSLVLISFATSIAIIFRKRK